MNKKTPIVIMGSVLLISSLLIGGRFIYFLFFAYISILIYSKYSIKKIINNIVAVYWIDKIKVEKGEDIEVRYKIYNGSLLPVPYIEIKDGIPERLSKSGGEERVYFMKPYDSIIIEKKVKCNHRGKYQLGEIEAVTGDVFGLFTTKAVIKDSINLTVYPKVFNIDKFSILGKEFFGLIVDNQKQYEDYSSIKDIRKYQQGDSIKRVNWKVTAKKGELYVKNYDYSSKLELQVYLDFQVEKYITDKDETVEEKVIEIVISIINLGLSKETDTRFVTYTDRKVELHGKGLEKLRDFLELMVEIRPKNNASMGDLITSEANTLSLGATIIIVTPRIDSKMKTSVLTLSKRGYNVVIILVVDLLKNKYLLEDLYLLNEFGIETYEIDVQDDISVVLR